MKAQANEDLPDDKQVEKSDLPTNDNDLEMPNVEQRSPSRHFRNMEFVKEAQAEAPQQRKWVDWYSRPVGKMMQARADTTWKKNPLWNSTSSLNLMSVQTAVFDERVAEATRAGENAFAATRRIAVESAKWEAQIRADKPFGSLGETNFDKMRRLLQSRPRVVRPSSDFTVKYTSVSSGGATSIQPVQTETQGNLNVGNNGYVSTVMQKQPPVTMGMAALKAQQQPLTTGINRGAIATRVTTAKPLTSTKSGLAYQAH
jgi:hypothetical protein